MKPPGSDPGQAQGHYRAAWPQVVGEKPRLCPVRENQKRGGEHHTDAVEADRRFDGKFVLRTNTKLSPAEVAKTYKGLWRVERTFRRKNPPWSAPHLSSAR